MCSPVCIRTKSMSIIMGSQCMSTFVKTRKFKNITQRICRWILKTPLKKTTQALGLKASGEARYYYSFCTTWLYKFLCATLTGNTDSIPAVQCTTIHSTFSLSWLFYGVTWFCEIQQILQCKIKWMFFCSKSGYRKGVILWRTDSFLAGTTKTPF